MPRRRRARDEASGSEAAHGVWQSHSPHTRAPHCEARSETMVDEIDKPDRLMRPMNLERHDSSNASDVAVRRMLLVTSGNAHW